MKLPKDCKVELAASKTVGREALMEPYLDIKNGKGTIVATTGRIAVSIPVELDEKDTAGYVSGDVLRAARKGSKNAPLSVIVNGVASLDNGITMPREGESKDRQFPNWRAVFPEGAEHTITLSLNAAYLWALAQAMGTDLITLRMKDNLSSVLVEPAGDKPACREARGVFMPERP